MVMADPPSAWTGLAALPPADWNVRLAVDLGPAHARWQELEARSRALRDEIRRFKTEYARARGRGPLLPSVLVWIHEGSQRYLRLQDGLASLTVRYEDLVDPPRAWACALDPDLRQRGLSTSLAAGVRLYDDQLALLGILKDRKLRRIANAATPAYGLVEDALWKNVVGLCRPENRRRFERLAAAWDEAGGASSAPGRRPDPELASAIVGGTSYRLAREGQLARSLPTPVLLRRQRLLDTLERWGDRALGAVSRVFGNAIGQVETRKGKLWRRKEVYDHLVGVLQPLDLLLEKTPFRLTDAFIPGHFGHVAVWMGTEAELKALGVWEVEAMRARPMRRHRKAIRHRRSVLEALRSGVELNKLRRFLNVDDLAVLRPRHLTRDEKVASLVRGFQQVGKAYDFNFDVETTGTIVCSELPYHVYPGVRWHTEEQLGRFTISPDDVAQQAIGPDAACDLVVLYRDGRLLPDADAPRVFADLVKEG